MLACLLACHRKPVWATFEKHLPHSGWLADGTRTSLSSDLCHLRRRSRPCRTGYEDLCTSLTWLLSLSLPPHCRHPYFPISHHPFFGMATATAASSHKRTIGVCTCKSVMTRRDGGSLPCHTILYGTRVSTHPRCRAMQAKHMRDLDRMDLTGSDRMHGTDVDVNTGTDTGTDTGTLWGRSRDRDKGLGKL
jgi:hypothetical protein